MPDGANLDRVQIVEGWLENGAEKEKGALHEPGRNRGIYRYRFEAPLGISTSGGRGGAV
jgi:hypothetical protein